jgi:hypothetical protein
MLTAGCLLSHPLEFQLLLIHFSTPGLHVDSTPSSLTASNLPRHLTPSPTYLSPSVHSLKGGPRQSLTSLRGRHGILTLKANPTSPSPRYVLDSASRNARVARLALSQDISGHGPRSKLIIQRRGVAMPGGDKWVMSAARPNVSGMAQRAHGFDCPCGTSKLRGMHSEI